MILSFKTKINDKPTYFPEKIITGLFKGRVISKDKAIELFYPQALMKIIPMEYHGFTNSVAISQIKFDNSINHLPKIHTIRKDEKNEWEEGIMIDFFINANAKDMFQFAPSIPVISTQDIFMTCRGSSLEITIAKVGSYMGGEDFYLDAVQQGTLAINDGFEDYNDFRNYFIEAINEHGKKTGNYWFSGKIIHWTNLRYQNHGK